MTGQLKFKETFDQIQGMDFVNVINIFQKERHRDFVSEAVTSGAVWGDPVNSWPQYVFMIKFGLNCDKMLVAGVVVGVVVGVVFGVVVGVVVGVVFEEGNVKCEALVCFSIICPMCAFQWTY
jgi:hypothetical protein